MDPINESAAPGGHDAGILHDLRERVKELTALHGAARVLQDDERPVSELLCEVVALLPPAWQFPEIACGRIAFNGLEVVTGGFSESPWLQRATFRTSSDKTGVVEVYYRRPAPDAAEGPFLAEERNLVNSIAEMLRSFVERREARRALEEAHSDLERRVDARTTELVKLNRALQQEVAERKRNEEQIAFYRERLRSLASELSMTEEAERRRIASDLHDHIGQALASLKMKLLEIQRSAAFTGYEPTLQEMRTLLDRTIRTARTLTVEISPPVLYELGLAAAIHWLGEQFQAEYGVGVEVITDAACEEPCEVVRLTVFKAVREFLLNTAKHAQARSVSIRVATSDGTAHVDYTDDGVGCDPLVIDGTGPRTDTFGLFNVRERCEYLGGRFEFESGSKRGVSVRLAVPLQVSLERERQHAGSHRPRR